MIWSLFVVCCRAESRSDGALIWWDTVKFEVDVQSTACIACWCAIQDLCSVFLCGVAYVEDGILIVQSAYSHIYILFRRKGHLSSLFVNFGINVMIHKKYLLNFQKQKIPLGVGANMFMCKLIFVIYNAEHVIVKNNYRWALLHLHVVEDYFFSLQIFSAGQTLFSIDCSSTDV